MAAWLLTVRPQSDLILLMVLNDVWARATAQPDLRAPLALRSGGAEQQPLRRYKVVLLGNGGAVEASIVVTSAMFFSFRQSDFKAACKKR